MLISTSAPVWGLDYYQVERNEYGEYRALLVGNSDYRNGVADLQAPRFDVDRLKTVLQQSRYGADNLNFAEIRVLQDATKHQILENIRSTFKDADADDVSYFYFSGHGALDTSTGQAYICTVDAEYLDDNISVNELKAVLDTIKGTKIVIIDSCHSGGFISKSVTTDEPAIESGNIISDKFNNKLIKTFSESPKAYLIGNGYNVITAASMYEMAYESYEAGWGWGGHFTNAIVKGCGYSAPYYLADANSDGVVTFGEIYNYTKHSTYTSHVQVYSSDNYGMEFVGDFDFGAYEKFEKSSGLVNDVDLGKQWSIQLSNEVDPYSVDSQSVYVVENWKRVVSCSISLLPDRRAIVIKPINPYKSDTEYSIVIENTVKDINGNKLFKPTYMNFKTIP